MDIELAQALKEIAELKQQNTNLQEMLKAERSVTCKEEYLKRVIELEETNADLKQSLDWANERESEDIKRITDLKKENAELKEELKGKRCNCMTYLNFKDLEKQLTKAKEFLAKWVELSKPKLEGYPITPIQE